MKTKFPFIFLALILVFSLSFGVYNYQKQQAAIEKIVSQKDHLKKCNLEIAKSRYETRLYFSQERAKEMRMTEAQLEFQYRIMKAQIR